MPAGEPHPSPGGGIGPAGELPWPPEAVAQREALLDNLEQATHFGSWVWNLQTNAVHWSAELFRIFGFQPGQVQPSVEAFLERVHPEDRERIRAGSRAVAEKATPRPTLFRIVRPSGEIREVLLYGAFLPEHGGKFSIVAGALQDATEMRQVEAAAREQSNLMAAIFDFLPIGVTLKNLDGTYVYVNRHFAVQINTEPEQIVGATLQDLPRFDAAVGKTGLARIAKADAQVVADRRPVEMHVDFGSPARGHRVTRRMKFPFFNREDEVAGVITLSEDITDRRETEEQLRQAQKMELVGQLAGGVAHDFNNALQVAHGFTLLGLRDLENQDLAAAKDDLEKVMQACESATAITRKLLAFARQQMLQKKPVLVNDIIANVAGFLSRSLREDIELVLDLSKEQTLVKADAVAIEQVIMNLCVNSRDALPEGGQIMIRTARATPAAERMNRHGLDPGTPMIHISLRDNGNGMDEATLKRAFEPFFTTKEVGKGTGLGLAMVDGLMAQHDGFAEISSVPGEFTLVELFLPQLLEGTAEPSVARFHFFGPTGGGTILVAEDDPSVRNLFARVLREAGYTVVLAVDGQEAWEQFSSAPAQFALVFLDAMMPRLTGIAALKKMRARVSQLPAIICTGHTEESFGAGEPDRLTRYLTKPTAPQVVLAAVAEMLAAGSGQHPAP